jgi:hypothetical protein
MSLLTYATGSEILSIGFSTSLHSDKRTLDVLDEMQRGSEDKRGF